MKHTLLAAAVVLSLSATAARADTHVGSIPLPVKYSGNLPNNALTRITLQSYLSFDWTTYSGFLSSGQSLYARLCMSYTDSGNASVGDGIWAAIIPYQYNGSNAHYWLFNSTGSSSTVSNQVCSTYSDGGPTVNGWLSTSYLSCLTSVTSSCYLSAYARSSSTTVPVTINSAWLEVIAR